jgi:nucleoside-diphosphate-sugar epimerase
MEGDVLDIDSLEQAMQGCTHVFHCAAIVSYHPSERDEMYRVNTEGTANVINIALHLGNVKVGFISSIAAIGKAKNNDHVDEESEWVENELNTHYAITKQLSEMEFWRGIHEGLEGVAFNCGFIIGPGSFERSSPSMFRKLHEGMRFYPPGGTGFIAVTDAARGIADLTLGPTSRERYILVTENLSMKEIFQLVAQALEVRVPSQEAKPWILQLARMAELCTHRHLWIGHVHIHTWLVWSKCDSNNHTTCCQRNITIGNIRKKSNTNHNHNSHPY